MTKIRPNRWAGEGSHPAAVLICLLLALTLLCLSCSKSDPDVASPSKRQAVPVTVAAVTQKDVPLQLDTFGRAQSTASVTIKAQVAQVLEKVHFQEGQTIARGDLLFTLNSRPYMVDLAHARAVMARDKILLVDAQLEAHRDAELLTKKILAQEDYDKVKASADALVETVKADQAAIDTAQIDVDNCRIFSPIAGRAGKILVHAGNLVTANDIPLVVINQIRPIEVFFSLPQTDLDRIRAYRSKEALAVEATIPNEQAPPAQGTLTFIDNSIDPASGTIELGATFPNPDERLWPGRYVLVHLVLHVEHDATVVPLRAIVTGSSGPYVFVIKDGKSVTQRTVKIARTLGDEAVLAAGLQPGEEVVTDGQLQLEEGTDIVIISGGSGDASRSPLSPARGVTPP